MQKAKKNATKIAQRRKRSSRISGSKFGQKTSTGKSSPKGTDAGLSMLHQPGTWEAFGDHITTCREMLWLVCPYLSEASEDVEIGKLLPYLQGLNVRPESLEPQIRRAWEALETQESRVKAQDLIVEAALELRRALQEKGSYSTRRQYRVAETEKQALAKTHRSVNRAGQKFLETLRKYKTSIASPVLNVRFTGDLSSVELESEEWKADWDARADWSETIDECVAQATELVERITNLTDPLYPDPPQKAATRGRNERQRFNRVLLELNNTFRAQGCSNNKAIQHTHSILHASGLWSDPDHSGLTAKLSQRRKATWTPPEPESSALPHLDAPQIGRRGSKN